MDNQPHIKIPASVGILTLNSVKELLPTLESIKRFADVYICDGNSTDGTQDLAKRYGARVTKQFDNYEPNQRLKSFADARNRCLSEAKYEWFIRLDSDERLSPEVVEEIEKIDTDANPSYFVYKMPRKYIWMGKIIDHAITYPNRQIRLFHEKAVAGYTKITHERVVVKPGFNVGLLRHPQYAPMQDNYNDFWKKFERGLYFDELQFKNITFSIWLEGIIHTVLLLTLYLFRLIKVRLSSGNKLPLAFELVRFRYQFRALGISTKSLLNRLVTTAKIS